MRTRIHLLPFGICNCYLVQGEGLVLVDAGPPGKESVFQEKLDRLSINPREISLIFLTHGHRDHVGGTEGLKKLTGGRVAISSRERDCVEKAVAPEVRGVGVWGTLLASVMSMIEPFATFPTSFIDWALEDDHISLNPFGIAGRVLYTPGHTSGSMSLLLDTGEAFVGDLAMNGFPLRIGPGMPVFATDVEAVKESWRLLLGEGANMIYPGHWTPFGAGSLDRFL
jgi:glyoxylase-like metal-dependent hydrolase (beta-lactamase superfamily II)